MWRYCRTFLFIARLNIVFNLVQHHRPHTAMSTMPTNKHGSDHFYRETRQNARFQTLSDSIRMHSKSKKILWLRIENQFWQIPIFVYVRLPLLSPLTLWTFGGCCEGLWASLSTPAPVLPIDTLRKCLRQNSLDIRFSMVWWHQTYITNKNHIQEKKNLRGDTNLKTTIKTNTEKNNNRFLARAQDPQISLSLSFSLFHRQSSLDSQK